MNKGAFIFLSLSLFSWSAAVLSLPEKHLLGTLTENGAKVRFYLEIKRKEEGQTELTNQSGSKFVLKAELAYKSCNINLFPDYHISYYNVAGDCRGEREYQIEYQGEATKNSRKVYIPNKNFRQRVHVGFEKNAKYFIITNSIDVPRSKRLNGHADLLR